MQPDGEIEEAIKLLDDEKLRQSVAQANETIEQKKIIVACRPGFAVEGSAFYRPVSL